MEILKNILNFVGLLMSLTKRGAQHSEKWSFKIDYYIRSDINSKQIIFFT